MSRPLWFEVAGKREVVGTVYTTVYDTTRAIHTRPRIPVNPEDIALKILRDTLKGFKVHATVLQDGVIQLHMGCNQQYGQVCREIARAYFLAINSPNPRPQEAQ